MKKTWTSIRGERLPVHSLNTLIIGSGAAALNAAVCLHDLGVTDIAVATDRWGGGTSNNAGSDKQTYYKVSLAGELPDSAFRMAVDLFSGGSMHGDIALAEAQNSARAFFRLVELGVPFPHDPYGAYVGYKTDHDPKQRATSAGPLTSRLMFEALAREVERRRIAVFDRHQVIGLLSHGHGPGRSVIGAQALDLDRLDRTGSGHVLFNAVNIVLGTGGPAGIYGASVYPESQLGSHGLAFEIGAAGQNLTESQFGLASIKFRWNLSGTYQQVIPRYVSTDAAGRDEREFLSGYFPDMGKLATAIFLKGYQWPFDAAKVAGFGSSLIDLLVFQETVGRGRRVFLDYRRNPGRRRPAGGVLVRAVGSRRPCLSRAVRRSAADAHRAAGPDEPAGDRPLPESRHRPRRRAAGDRPLRPAQQRRPQGRSLVGIERRPSFPGGRSERQPRRAASGRLGAQLRTGGRAESRPVHLPSLREDGPPPRRRSWRGRAARPPQKSTWPGTWWTRDRRTRSLVFKLRTRDPGKDVGLGGGRPQRGERPAGRRKRRGTSAPGSRPR